MLRHNHTRARKPSRVVVLGSSGFIARTIRRRLESDDIDMLALGRPELDLLTSVAAERLTALLRSDDVLIVVSARVPCKDAVMFYENIRMIDSVCTALRQRPVAHLVYLSSDAVYEDRDSPITEESYVAPNSLHGEMHLTREIALRQAHAGPLAIVRPTLVYGLDDPHNGYGPNLFRRLAAAGKEIVLFGNGEEQRDHVHVEDVADLVRLIILHRSAGIANAVTGQVVSFRELAEFVAAAFLPCVNVSSTPRSGPIPHKGYRAFDNSAVRLAFPSLEIKSWSEGLTLVHKSCIFKGTR